MADVGGNELVQVDVSDLVSKLRQLEARGKSVARVTPQVAAILVNAVEDEFSSQGASSGGWAELAPSTLARRRKRGRGAKILQDTGVLAGSIRPDHGDDYGQAGTDVPYAIFHVSSRPRKKIPKRDFLAVDTEDVMSEIEGLLVAELVDV